MFVGPQAVVVGNLVQLQTMACLAPTAEAAEVAGKRVVHQKDSGVGPIGCWPVDCWEVQWAGEDPGSMAEIPVTQDPDQGMVHEKNCCLSIHKVQASAGKADTAAVLSQSPDASEDVVSAAAWSCSADFQDTSACQDLLRLGAAGQRKPADLDGSILADQDTLLVVQTAADSAVQKVAQEVPHIQYVPGNQGAEQAPCIYCKGPVPYLAACSEMAGW